MLLLQSTPSRPRIGAERAGYYCYYYPSCILFLSLPETSTKCCKDKHYRFEQPITVIGCSRNLGRLGNQCRYESQIIY